MPSQFIGSVEKGVRSQLEHGLDNDHIPVVDVLVTLLDGKAHSVDSSDAAFQMAGALAVKDAASSGGVSMLEPLASVDITVPDAHVGAVLSDMSGRRQGPGDRNRARSDGAPGHGAHGRARRGARC